MTDSPTTEALQDETITKYEIQVWRPYRDHNDEAMQSPGWVKEDTVTQGSMLGTLTVATARAKEQVPIYASVRVVEIVTTVNTRTVWVSVNGKVTEVLNA